MTIKEYKIYMEEVDYHKLLSKANLRGYTGRGAVSRWLREQIANQPICYLDENLKLFAETLKLGENGK